MVGEDEIQGSIHSDGELGSEDFTLDIAQLLKDAEPWGQNFPEPLFDGFFKIVDQRIVGKRHLKLRLKPDSHAQAMDAIAFNVIDHGVDELPYQQGEEIHAAFKLDVNEFRGQRTLQLMIQHLQRPDEAVIEEEAI